MKSHEFIIEKIKRLEEGKDNKIAQLKKDHDTAVHWSKNETSPQKREAARQKAEKIKRHLDTQYKQGVVEAGFPGAPDVEMPPMKSSGDPQRDKLKQEYVDLHREIKSLVDLQYNSKSTEEKMQAKARIKQLNDRADQIRAILEPRQPPNEWQKKTYGYDDNWNEVGKGVAEGSKDNEGSADKGAWRESWLKQRAYERAARLKQQSNKKKPPTPDNKNKEKGVAEGAVKELSMDLRTMSDQAFQRRYKMTKAQARANLKIKPENMSEMRGFRGVGGARGRENDENEKIDAMLRQQDQQRRDYEQTGKFWLKQKDTQQHISDAMVGKAAASTAAVELLKQRPELRGNLVITAYGPGESQGVAEGQLDEIFNPSSIIAHFIRTASNFANDFIPAGLGALGTFAATTAVLGPVAGALAGSTVGNQVFQTLQNQQNKVPGMIQQLVQKYFGSEAEALEFAVLHAKAAFLEQPKFRWRGKQWPVSLKKNDAEAIIEKNDKYWLEQQAQQQGVAESSDELYGLRVGDTVKATVRGNTVQGDVIDIFPETMEVELLLRGANAGRTVTVDVRDTEALSEQGVAEGSTDDPRFQKMMGNIQKSTPNPVNGYVAVSYASERPSNKIKGVTYNGKPMPSTIDPDEFMGSKIKFTPDQIEEKLMKIGQKYGWDSIDPGHGQGYDELFFDTRKEYTSATQRQLAINIVKTVNEINKFFAGINSSLQSIGLPGYKASVWQGMGENGNINQYEDLSHITNIAKGQPAKPDAGPAIGKMILKHLPSYEAENDELGYDPQAFTVARAIANTYITQGERAGLAAQGSEIAIELSVSSMIDELLSDAGGSGLRTTWDLNEQGVAEGYYDLPNQGNVPGMEPIDFSSKPSFKELITRYTQLVYQGHASETSPEEDQEYDAIEKYVAQRFGEKGSAHLQKAGEVSYWGRNDKPYGRDSRSSNLGRPNQPSGDFRTTKAGKMHGQDAKMMKAKVADRVGRHPEPNLPEGVNGEYDDEAGLADQVYAEFERMYPNLARRADDRVIHNAIMSVLNYGGDNDPGALAGDVARAVKQQMQSGVEEGVTESVYSLEQAHAIFDDFEQAMADRGLTEDIFNFFTDEEIILETAAWRRSAGKSKKGGLNAKGVASYRRENPGSKLQMAVTTKPSKLKPGSKAAKRRKSFCARMGGVKGPMKKPNGKPTRKALALRKWNC
jgi:hypothetical protein